MAFSKQPRIYKAPEGVMYAGTADLVAKITVDGKRVVYLIDFKTGKAPKDKAGYGEWPLQTASYRNGIAGVEGNAIVHLDKESGLPTWFDYSTTYPQDLEAFKFLCEFWRNRNAEWLTKGVPSSTTVCGQLDKPALMWWAAGCACDYVRETVSGYKTVSIDMLYATLDRAKKQFRSVSQKAMDVGTTVHQAIEHWFKTGEEPRTPTTEVLAGFLAFLEWHDKHEVEAIEVEKVIYGRY